jgi:BlaI family transcriptional regulator, penicillinase repressor
LAACTGEALSPASGQIARNLDGLGSSKKVVLTPFTNVTIYMCNQFKEERRMAEVTISDAEWQVMNVIWDGQGMTSQEVVGRLEGQADWAPATVKTMLHRLVKKGVLTYELNGNRYVYRSSVRRANCVKQAGRSFLDRVFGGESASLLAHFLRSSKLSAEEISQLRQMLDEQEG